MTKPARQPDQLRLVPWLNFVVPGAPRAKGRPRFVRATGRVYTPAVTASYENLIALAAEKALEARGDTARLTDSAAAVLVTAYVARPTTGVGRWRAAPTTRPDADNYLKAVLDGCRVLWRDDSQVVHASVEKVYSDAPRLEVRVLRQEQEHSKEKQE